MIIVPSGFGALMVKSWSAKQVHGEGAEAFANIRVFCGG